MSLSDEEDYSTARLQREDHWTWIGNVAVAEVDLGPERLAQLDKVAAELEEEDRQHGPIYWERERLV